VWFGLVHLSPDAGDDVERESVIVVAYEPHRLFRVGASLEAAPEVLATLREASDHGRRVGAPRCGSCDAPITVPPVDEDESCASA